MTQQNQNQNQAPSTAVVTTKAAKLENLASMFEKKRASIAAVLPKHLTAERLAKIALSAASRSPDILACDPASVYLAVLQAAELGLEFGTVLGQAYMVPFDNKHTKKKEAQFIPGYRGLISLARRSGEIKSIEAVLVYEKDEFEMVRGLDTTITHKPCLRGEPGPVVLAYAVAHFKDGGFQCEVMTLAQLDAIRDRSQAKNSGPWVTDTEEMYRKTVIRRLFKYLPMSVEMAKAVTAMDVSETGNTADLAVFDVVATAETQEAAELPPAPVESLKDRLRKKAEEEAPVVTKPAREPGED